MNQLLLPGLEPRHDYVTVGYESTIIDQRNGEPFRWRNVVETTAVDRVIREARKRWPGYRIEVEA